jgi:Protein of unknown function (DUF4085)
MQFFKRKVMYPSRRTEETSKEIDKLFKEYAAHIKAVRDSLPEGARALFSFSFHDATIKEVRHISKQEVEIVIEGGGYDVLSKSSLEYGGYTLSFSGVKKAWVPYTIVGDIWLYEEMHLSDVAAFDYQVLLDKDEIRIQADDVRLTQSYKWSSKSS